MTHDTIFALSSGAPPAAIAVMRISGPDAGAAIVALAGSLPVPRRATLRWLTDAATGERLDRALLLWLPGPATATGEDLAELHLHGGRAVVAAVESALARLPGSRRAEPGEFTRRAFHNQVIDLAAAEGLADLLAAETEGQRRAALRQAEGALGREVERWRVALLAAAAQLEALFDFADEDDVIVDLAAVRKTGATVAAEIAELRAAPPAERLRDGVRIVIAGPPNAGKSTLLNALIGRDAALVAAEAGTTRDVIEAPVALGGMPLLLADTAGLRAGTSDVERAGIDRARAALATADIILWLGDPADAPTHAAVIRVHARADAAGRQTAPRDVDVIVSAHSGAGMANLTERLLATARSLLPSADALTLNRRQRDLLRDAEAALSRVSAEQDPLLVAEELRHALRRFDAITGRAGVEDMLDTLFSRFCIGK